MIEISTYEFEFIRKKLLKKLTNAQRVCKGDDVNLIR